METTNSHFTDLPCGHCVSREMLIITGGLCPNCAMERDELELRKLELDIFGDENFIYGEDLSPEGY